MRSLPILSLILLLTACADYSLVQGELNEPLPEEPEQPAGEDHPVRTLAALPLDITPAGSEEPPPPPPPADDCLDTEDLVYVIDRDDEAMYLFDPVSGGFTFLGDLNCGMWIGTPSSMAVARDGFAYVRYSSNEVFAVDLVTMQCSPTPYGESFGSFGMGYATDSAGTWQDALYVANSGRLARMDTGTFELSDIGAMPSQSELTGNAAGELWAFLPLEQPARLVELDKDDASVLRGVNLPGFPDPSNIDTFAFATWGGDFWLFVRSYGMGNSTDIYRVTANGQMSLAAADTGMNVVGAGVSTCAPTN